jgi:tetratricopeptide (TPR) repeat protein
MNSPATGPSIAQAYAMALAHHRDGSFREAELLYRQILARQPGHADALHMLGVMALQAGQHADALKLIGRAAALQPANWEFQSNLGLVHRAMGQPDEELACYRRALALRPSEPGAHYNVGVALSERKEFGPAIAEYRQALALWPDSPEALNNLGEALREIGQLEEAVAIGRRAVALRPNWPQALSNLALSLRENDELDEAIATHQRALSLNGDFPECLSGFGHALRMSGRLDEAIAVLRRACSLKPDWPPARWNLAHALLVKDHTMEGWLAYESRRKLPKQVLVYDDPKTEWTGSELRGRRLLVHAEQGFGDVIQMARYLPLLAQRGATVLLECHAELAQLMRTVEGVSQVIARGGGTNRQFDLHIPIMSLPLRFGTTTATIPASVPYIRAAPQKAEQWSRKLADRPQRLKIGLAWAGSAEHREDRKRSIPLQAFAPLSHTEQFDFYSLQKGRGAEQAKSPPPGLHVIDLTEHLHDWSDTAALMANLDLVISVDTAVAHLAGAMGKPALVLLPFMPDWRWLMDRGDSPWYPTVRLFRQAKAGDWQASVEQVANALRKMAKEKRM